MKRFLVFVLLALSLTISSEAQRHGEVHVAILGDNNTWLGGDSCNKPRGWTKWFVQKFKPTSCLSYARKGATWTNTAKTKYNITENSDIVGDDNVIYNQINRLIDACKKGRQHTPDLILISAGANDAMFIKLRPYAYAFSVNQAFANTDIRYTKYPINKVLSLSESVRYGCEMIQEHFPNARIILITPMQTMMVSDAMIQHTGDIIDNCGRKMHISVIRMDFESCVKSSQETRTKKYTYDGTHTSREGAWLNGYHIAMRVASLIDPNRQSKNSYKQIGIYYSHSIVEGGFEEMS